MDEIELEALLVSSAPLPTSSNRTDSISSPAHGGQIMKTGVAFSGGGIRSAALCSGVLRRLLEDGVEPDYLSCVSGGGYTGAAYMDWKYRNKGKDKKSWHKMFFEQIEIQSGLFCDWQNCCTGFGDCFIFGMMIFVVLLVSLLAFISLAFPLAFLVDCLFGKLLEAKRFRCKETDVDCEFPVGSMSFKRMWLFLGSFLVFVIFHIISRYSRNGLVNVIKVLSGSAFAFTFFPWCINDYLEYTVWWVKYIIIALSILTWFFLPILRRYSSLVIIVFLTSYVVYWHVYEEEVIFIQHTDNLFFWFLFTSLVVWCIASFTGQFQLRIVHIYNRWRLQKAFFTKESTKGCRGIGWLDFFPGSYCCTPSKGGIQQTNTNSQAKQETDQASTKREADADSKSTTSEQRTRKGEPLSPFSKEGALTLADLNCMGPDMKPLKPLYISNIVVNDWRVRSESNKFSLLTMSPKEIERLNFKYTTITEEPQVTKDNFAGKLDPGDIKLSSAMAMSAAAVSPHLGAYQQEEQAYRHILSWIGLDMAAYMAYDMSSLRIPPKNCCKFFLQALPFIIRCLFVSLIAILPILHLWGVSDSAFYLAAIGVGAVAGAALVLLASVLMFAYCEGGEGCFNNILRWLTVHVPLYRLLRAILCRVHTGPVPPPMLHLSDGGHFENLGLLPLLQRRLQRILVINGGQIESDSTYGEDLVKALDLAREKLNCSFIGIDGRDVLEDIKDKFVKKKDGEKPRHYKFRVQYYNKTEEFSEGVRDKEKDGEIILISPRHPTKGVKDDSSDPDEERCCCCCCYKRKGGKYDVEAALTADDVDRLTFCCCECCHRLSCKRISECMCGAFPAHMTLNQFFTPVMFRSYHIEGYRACVEANAVEFLNVHNKEQCGEIPI